MPGAASERWQPPFSYMNYVFSLAQQRFRILLPGSISLKIENRHQPFIGPDDGGEVCGTISFELTDILPPLPEQSVMEQYKLYCPSLDNLTWFLDASDHTPFAYSDRRQSPKRVEIVVHTRNESYLSSSNAIMLMIETEDLLRRCGGLMMHGCLVDTPRGGIVFTGPSGIGKSTQGSLWESFGNGRVLNGDRVGLCQDEDGWSGWGLPFAGSSQVYLNEGTAVKALIVLKQGEENSIRRLAAGDALKAVYPQAHLHRWSRDFMEQGTGNLMSLIARTPVYLLCCRPDKAAVDLVQDTVFGVI